MDSKLAQLEELNQAIADENAKTIQMKQLIAEKARTIAETKSHLRNLRCQRITGTSAIDLPSFDAYDDLEDEYKDMLDEKLNLIADLRNVCTEIEDETALAEEETDVQFHRNSELTAELQQTEYEIFQEEMTRIAANTRKESLLAQIKELDTVTKQAEYIQTRTENALSEAMKRAENKDDAIFDLQNLNHNLTQEINDIEEQINTATSELNHYKELSRDDNREHSETLSSLNAMYGFENVKKNLQEELKNIQDLIEDNQQQCSQIEEEIKLKQKRLSVLRSLKTKAPMDQPVRPDVTIDDLISELKIITKRQEQLEEETAKEYDELVSKNIETEKKIEQEQHKFDVMLARFESEQAELKKKIHAARRNVAQEEQELLQTMNELALKLASSPRPMKSRIAAPVNNRVAIPGSALMSVNRINILPSPDKQMLSMRHPSISDC